MELFWPRLSILPSGAPKIRLLARRLQLPFAAPGSGREANNTSPKAAFLPPVMGKRLVGFRHAVNVFLLLDRGAAVVGGVEQFIAQLVDHALLAASSGVGNQPADSQRGAPVGIHF